ncbi:Gfo/Idh/MocA family protein [Tichowtungia aerotolerans]|uniref:Gfo/Idh/MocA family oxidoreductase n=1 Tax=Tichowtungia aerotolerans TaxID=2697043 RepID=A0A6P1M383_9BACT|nr:Gfo/Idh/MocA family oxidoreductase [Tichowtungia aerotolerans]QHI68281.1 Gfo/Idh/MocA family oxidoreductase [Tichowtungia aerotolerans]
MDIACETMNLAIVGCGGYAGYLIDRIADLPGLCRLVAVTTRRPDSDTARKFKAQGVAVLENIDELLETMTPEECPTLIIPTSIESHYEYTKKAIDAGFHVLLEKPPAATVQDVDRLIELQQSSDKWIAVNFQHLFNPMSQHLKKRLAGGEFGAVKSVRARALWMRPESYFSRSSWSGKLKVDGQWVLDGTIGNPLAHLLAEALYLATPKDGMATPVNVQAELYHGNDIESEDTSCLRLETEDGVPVFYCASLCSKEMTPIFCEIETENADICLVDYFQLSIRWKDGRIEEAETPDNNNDLDRLIMLETLVKSLSNNERPLITVEECRSYMLAWNGAFESFGVPAAVPESAVSSEINEMGPVRCIPGFLNMAEQASREMKLFSELGVEWAEPGKQIDLTEYTAFPSENKAL